MQLFINYFVTPLTKQKIMHWSDQGTFKMNNLIYRKIRLESTIYALPKHKAIKLTALQHELEHVELLIYMMQYLLPMTPQTD